MKKLLLFVFAALAFAACTQDVVVDITPAPIVDEAPETLVVGFEGNDTRIQLQNGKTVWTKGDLVSVFYRSNANQLWKYDGETGERTAYLKRVDAGTATRDMDRVVVVYPYNEDYYINPSTYNVQATLPAMQSYLEDSYGLGGNIMISQSEYNQFSLKSVCGWLKLQLTGNGEKISSITLRGNNSEQVAGELYINSADATALLAADMGSADDNNAGGSLIFDDTILKEVTLDCGEGVALGKSTTAFYIALPPQTFTQGLTVEITDDSGYTMTQATDKEVAIERNTIQPMAAIEFINPNRPTQPTPANNQIWYTATEKVDPYFDDFLTFGSNVDSNVWDSETKRGVITFDGDVTMIGDDAFNNCDKFTGITLPECVTSIGKKAFYDCDGLTEFTIPDSVTEVGANAFYSCGKLASVTIGDSVTTIGDSSFCDCRSLTSVNILDSVTSIEKNAFRGCSNLTSVTIPDSVTTIGDSSFFDCRSLTSVNIPDSVTTIGKSAFYYCSSLTSVTIPDSVTTIGNSVFRLCTSLTNVNIPDSVTTIGNYAFASCYSLTSVNIPDSVTTIGEGAFEWCTSLTSVNIGDSVTTIGNYAFASCTSLTSVNIGDSVTTIGYYAFASCPSLTEFKGKFATEDGRSLIVDNTIIAYANASGNTYTIPDSVTEIGEYAFASCDSLTSVNIGDSVTTIGGNAFRDCTSLTKVYCYATIPPSLGSNAFYNNASVRRIYVYKECVILYKSAWSSYKDSIYANGENCPETTTTIEYTTNDGNIVTPKNMLVVSNIYDNGVGTLVVVGKITQIPNNAFNACKSLTSMNIPDSVTSIGNDAFSSCTSLTSVNIPDSVTSIGNDAFSSCTSLTSVNIPDSVTEIGNEAFKNCSNLTSATIGDSVTSIGYYAFYYCTSLTSVYCKATTPPSLGYDVFDNNGSGRKIYVPVGSVNAYKSATNWSEYKSAIVGYDFENGVVVE